MAIARNEYRYVVIVYEHSTDTTAVASVSEYVSSRSAEEYIESCIDAGLDVKNIRVFHTNECLILTKEVTIVND